MMARLLYFKNNYRVSFKGVWENFGQVSDQFKYFEIFNTHTYTIPVQLMTFLLVQLLMAEP